MSSKYPPHGSFKLIRPKLSLRSNDTTVDPYASIQIDVIVQNVGKKVWPPSLPKVPTRAKKSAATTTDNSPCSWKEHFLEMCGQGNLEGCIDAIGKISEEPCNINLEELLNKDGKTSLLYKVQNVLKATDLSFNQLSLLSHGALELFLFAHAIYVKELEDPAAIAKYITDEDDYAATAQLYEIISRESIKSLASKKKINIGQPNVFWKRKKQEILEAKFSFEKNLFKNDLLKVINDYAFNNDILSLIESADNKLGLSLTNDDKNFLVDYFQRSNIKIDTPDLAERFIPIALSHQKNATLNFLSPGTATNDSLDFSVSYYEETGLASEINRENVHCAAQLFYVMTLGEELGIFPAADMLITKYLATGIVDVRSPPLLRDLQSYSFNDQFADLNSGIKYGRSQAEERRMFYRQVFNFGDSSMMEGQMVNTEFESLWNSLMVETVRFIEKMESSERPEAFVSRQNVAQPLEDLQYNLSTYCSGMAKIYSPIINRELDFIIERLFKSPEIIDQLALHNSRSFKKVLERVLQDDSRMQDKPIHRSQSSVNISTLFNKAMYGHKILSFVANYTPSMIDDDAKFSELISTIEAFIITSSQMERELPTPWQTNQDPPLSAYPTPDTEQANFGSNEWNF